MHAPLFAFRSQPNRFQQSRFESSRSQQSGVALLISLVILLVLTVLGVQAMKGTVLEERMAGNFKDRRIAFESAEAGLDAAETYINLLSSPPTADSTASAGIYTFGSPDIYDDSFWDDIDAQAGLAGTAEGPRYVIEARGKKTSSGDGGSPEIGAVTKSNYSGQSYGYRITSRGVGSTTSAVVILQSDYTKQF